MFASFERTGIGVPSQFWALTWKSSPPMTGPGAAGTVAGSTGIAIEIRTDWAIEAKTRTVTRPSGEVKTMSCPGVEQDDAAGGADDVEDDTEDGAAGALPWSLLLPLPLSFSSLSLPLLPFRFSSRPRCSFSLLTAGPCTAVESVAA